MGFDVARRLHGSLGVDVDGDFALEIEAFQIVVMRFGNDETVANEDHRGGNRAFRFATAGEVRVFA